MISFEKNMKTMITGKTSKEVYLLASLKKALRLSFLKESSFEKPESNAVVIGKESRVSVAEKLKAALKLPIATSFV